MAKVKNNDKTKFWQDMEEMHHKYIATENVKCYPGKTHGHFFKKLNM